MVEIEHKSELFQETIAPAAGLCELFQRESRARLGVGCAEYTTKRTLPKKVLDSIAAGYEIGDSGSFDGIWCQAISPLATASTIAA
jgi:hypothetical protein